MTKEVRAIAVFDEKTSDFESHKKELKNLGYEFVPSSDLNILTTDQADIYIIHIDLLTESQDVLKGGGGDIPFLISGMNELPASELEHYCFEHSVGFFADKPSLDDIRLKIELGLHLHNERQQNSRRLQNVNEKFESNRVIGIATGLLMSWTKMNTQEIVDGLKVASRNKQRRMWDVAEELIDIFNQKPELRNGKEVQSVSSLIDWLDQHILKRR